MHDCPECGQACDCDGEDTWFSYVRNCTHECTYEDDDFDDEFDDEWSEESGK